MGGHYKGGDEGIAAGRSVDMFGQLRCFSSLFDDCVRWFVGSCDVFDDVLEILCDYYRFTPYKISINPWLVMKLGEKF